MIIIPGDAYVKYALEFVLLNLRLSNKVPSFAQNLARECAPQIRLSQPKRLARDYLGHALAHFRHNLVRTALRNSCAFGWR